MDIIEKAWMRAGNGKIEVFLTAGGREFSSSVAGEGSANLDWIVGGEADFLNVELPSGLPKAVSLALTQCLARAQARTKLWRLFSSGPVSAIPMPAVTVLRKQEGIGEFFIFPKFAGGMNEALTVCNKAYQKFREIPKNPKDDLKVLEVLSQVCMDSNCSIGISVSDGFARENEKFIEGVKNAFKVFVLREVVKLSDFPTVSAALDRVGQIKSSGKALIVGENEKETLDSFAADFAVGGGAAIFKGSLDKREGVVKFNRLLDIALEVGEKVKWAGLPY